MNKFPEPGLQYALSADDIAGIKELYGEFLLPFPDEGKYALNAQDKEDIAEAIQIENTAGLTNAAGRKAAAESLKQLISFTEYRDKKSNRQLYDEFAALTLRQTQKFSQSELKLQRRLLTVGTVTAVRMQEDRKNGINDMDLDFISLPFPLIPCSEKKP